MLAAGLATRLKVGALVLGLAATTLCACVGTPTPTPTREPVLHLAYTSEVESIVVELLQSSPFAVKGQECSWDSCLALASSGYADAALIWGPEPPVGPQLAVEPWAADALAIIVNPRNQVGPLEREALRGIFSGRVQDWAPFGQGLGAIQVMTRERGSGPRELLSRLVMAGEPPSGNARVAASDDAVLDYVASEPAAIGYVSAASLREGVRALTVEGMRPEPQKVRDGLYSLMAGIWLVYRPESIAEELRSLLSSDAGQEVLSRYFAAPELAFVRP